MKKKFLAALAVVCLLLSGTASVIPFTDVPPDAWYANTVSAACASGIMQGRRPQASRPQATEGRPAPVRISFVHSAVRRGKICFSFYATKP